MIISKRKFEERIREAVDKEMQRKTLAEEQREIRREIYGEFERVRMHMNQLERRIEEMEGKKRSAVMWGGAND